MNFAKKFLIFSVIALLPYFSYAETNQTLPEKYKDGKTLKILIVPGHDNENTGAIYNDKKEADLNLALAKKLEIVLKKDKQFEITVARDNTGYIKKLSDYFDNNKEKVEAFSYQKRMEMAKKISSGQIVVSEQVVHASAEPEAAYKLLAINMWADENKYDLIIHTHFNDYGSHGYSAGEFDGYSVYVPDETLPNNEPSKTIGENIGKRLGKIWNTSNASTELKKIDANGVIEDSDLIALGSNGTLSTPSVLIEYSYIYEPIISSIFFNMSTVAMARATAMGLYDYLSVKIKQNSTFTYNWYSNLTTSKTKKSDVLALQYALSELGYYPPKGKGRDDCPMTGMFGTCTKTAVKNFQTAKKIQSTGNVGPITIELLNKLF